MAKRDHSVFDVSHSEPINLHDALQALTAINQDLTLLDYANVIIRRGYQDSPSVRVFSGGVAGTDLHPAIFVGRGMLTAAIIGENGTPSSRQILRLIKELNNNQNSGIFVIVQANTDLFNFGLAVQRAELDCRTRIKLLVIDDDKRNHKERYSCGMILVSKILGAMAEEGASFNDMLQISSEIISHLVTVPLHYSNQFTETEKTITVLTDFEKLVKEVMTPSSSLNLSLHPSTPLVVLINNSREMNRFTQFGLIKKVIEKFQQLGICLVRLYYGSFLTMPLRTVTLTIFKIFDNNLIKYLDAECDASGWKQRKQYLPEVRLNNEISGFLKHAGKQPIELKGPKLESTQVAALTKALKFACDAIISCERQINIIDEEKSVGNLGTRLKNFAEHLNKRIANQKLLIERPYCFFKKLGMIAEGSIGGTMGSIYGLLFENGADVFAELGENDPLEALIWARAFSHALETLSLYFPEKYQVLSMFYPLKCCENAIQKATETNQDYLQCYGIGVSTAEETAQETRAPNCKHPDAGAHAVGIWMRAIFEGVKIMSPPKLPYY